jgi:hypothetical protein
MGEAPVTLMSSGDYNDIKIILHNSLSVFCIKSALLFSEEILRPTIPHSSRNALYEQCADFPRSSSSPLL